MTDLRLKATPQILAGWCGPVWVTDTPETFQTVVDDIHVLVAGEWWETTAYRLCLDLSRAECRDRIGRLLRSIFPDSCWEYDIDKFDVLFADEAAEGRLGPWSDDLAEDVCRHLGENRRLPDGTRWASAWALWLVASRVLGGDS